MIFIKVKRMISGGIKDNTEKKPLIAPSIKKLANQIPIGESAA